ncbi:hypothetical protein [uncultured Thiohalocapsa sp.]|uniref:hypothetical protein n=1 Tax=uncultured Thiohalocapsa sp. TaxID=768990 RepID=UPI0025EAE5CD|nr:hypothetical protein [uncultured Thiohalocapsa sp.]
MSKLKHALNIGLMLVSLLCALVMAEFALRGMLFSDAPLFAGLRDASLFSHRVPDRDGDFYGEDYWKLRWIFEHKHNIQEPQPLLGWWGFFDPRTLEHHERDQIDGRRPVLLYGDSFAQCVESEECFEDILNRDQGFAQDHFLLNYGVGGFGLDQIALLFDETVDRLDAPFVIFSLLTTDLDRSLLSFRDAQKPYFVLEGDRLSLQGTPITLSTADHVDRNPPQIRSYLLNLLRNSLLGMFPRANRADAIKARSKSLNARILEGVLERLQDEEIEHVILVFHPQHHRADDWRLVFLREACERHGAECLFDEDMRTVDVRRRGGEHDPFRYALPNDGHPTSYANHLVARELAAVIEAADQTH